MNAKERLYKAMIESKDLLALLAGGVNGIDKDIAKGGAYPKLVYSLISDVPKLSADDTEELHKETLQISVITKDGNFKKIEKIIKQITETAGFSREYSSELYEDGEKIKIMRYVILEEEK